MKIKNFEFKAKVAELSFYENKLQAFHPIYQGEDHQIDTYFQTEKGRLKLREGTIENALIEYERENAASARKSEITLYRHRPDPALKSILINQFGIKVIVDKRRKIYFIDHVKFHFDTIDGLGTFLEVEAIDETGDFTYEQLQERCDFYFDHFELEKSQIQSESYSDMILNQATL